MNKTLWCIRGIFLFLCLMGGWLIWYASPDLETYLFKCLFVSGLIGVLIVLTDIMLKGFSLRGMTAITFGLLLGAFIAYIIQVSPLFEPIEDDYPEKVYLARLVLFVGLMYLGSVIALRGKDEFNLIIPYVKFVPHEVTTPLVLVDTSALIDGRIVGICETKWMGFALVIPEFVLEELHFIADSSNTDRQKRGRKGLETLNLLRGISHLDLRIEESDVRKGDKVDEKLIFLAKTLKAKILTTDYNLAKLAEFQNIEWLNISDLAQALRQTAKVGDHVQVELVKEGKEKGQAVGYLDDGSMVVVNNGNSLLNQKVALEIESVMPSGGGKIIFGKLLE